MDITSDPEHKNKPSPRSLLESLNTDVLISILSATGTLSDLHASIHATPILYQAFLADKCGILLAVEGAGQLGPVLPDALMLSHTIMSRSWGDWDDWGEDDPRQRSRQRGGEVPRVEDWFDEKVSTYRSLLESGPESLSVARRTTAFLADEATVICLVKALRAVDFFVDSYLTTRFGYFRRCGLGKMPQCTAESRLSERRALLRAFIRRQVVFNLFYNRRGMWRGLSEDLFDVRLSTLFAKWEMEQISQADVFILDLAEALRRCERLDDGGLLTREREQAMMKQFQMGVWTGDRRAAGAVQFVPVPREEYVTTLAQNVLALHHKIREVTRTDASFMERLLSFPSLIFPTDTEVGGHDLLRASHSPRLSHSPRQPPGTPPLPAASEPPPTSRLECPGAWREATGPWKELGWGKDLLPGTRPDDLGEEEWQALLQKFKIWRWAGIMFFDEERMEALKSAGLLTVEEGWLGRYNQETRDQLVRSLAHWPDGELNVVGIQLLNW